MTSHESPPQLLAMEIVLAMQSNTERSDVRPCLGGILGSTPCAQLASHLDLWAVGLCYTALPADADYAGR